MPCSRLDKAVHIASVVRGEGFSRPHGKVTGPRRTPSRLSLSVGCQFGCQAPVPVCLRGGGCCQFMVSGQLMAVPRGQLHGHRKRMGRPGCGRGSGTGARPPAVAQPEPIVLDRPVDDACG